jgi:hypothetical protein
MKTYESIVNYLKESICAGVSFKEKREGVIQVFLPISGRDGDVFNIYLKQDLGGWRITDFGSTLMRLSYEFDLDKLLTGNRLKQFELMLSEADIKSRDGELVKLSSPERLASSLFEFATTLVRVSDLGLWTHHRTESNFYDDLANELTILFPQCELKRDYPITWLGDGYFVDYRLLNGTENELYVFGVPSGDKAKLVTLTLERMLRMKPEFGVLVICKNMDDLPKLDRKRMINAANDIVTDMTEKEAISRKINRYLKAV